MGFVESAVRPSVMPLLACDQADLGKRSVTRNGEVGFPASEMSEFLDILKLLIREPSVVGNEDSFFRMLRRELEEIELDVQQYHGILVAKGNDPQSLYLSAHIDRHGLLCTGPNEFQYAAFIDKNKGEEMGDSVSEYMLSKIEDRFVGQRVQAHFPYTGTYLGQGEITHSYICPERGNLIFEVEGLEFLQPGIPIAFLDRLQISDGLISAQLDNVVSAAMIIYLFRKGFQGTGLFTAQEESGRSWRYIISWFQRQRLTTQRLVVLDTSPYASREEADAQQIVLRHCDTMASFSEQMTDELVEKCQQLGLSFGFKDEYITEKNKTRTKPFPLGRTELGRVISVTEGAISGTTLQVPTTDYHTSSETAALSAIAGMLRLLNSYL